MNRRHSASTWTMIASLMLALLPARGWAQEHKRPPLLTVSASADVQARPDRANVVAGATAQADTAAAAQQQVSTIVDAATKAIIALGIPQEAIQTSDLSLWPVYAEDRPRPADAEQAHVEPRVIGYRATNNIRVRVDDLSKIGPVVDAAIAAGATNLQELTFELKDNTAAYADALAKAAERAKSKATVLAGAMGLKTTGVYEVIEAGGPPIPLYRAAAGREIMMADAAAIQPGQLTISATVTVSYGIAQEAVGEPQMP